MNLRLPPFARMLRKRRETDAEDYFGGLMREAISISGIAVNPAKCPKRTLGLPVAQHCSFFLYASAISIAPYQPC